MIVLKLKGLSTSHDVKSEFETWLTNFDKIRNVNKFFSIKPNGEWTNETMLVFKTNRAALQMEILWWISWETIMINIYIFDFGDKS